MLTRRDIEKLKYADLGAYTRAEVIVLRANLLRTIRHCRDRSLGPSARIQLRRVCLSIRFRMTHRHSQSREENYLHALEKLGFSAYERHKLSQL